MQTCRVKWVRLYTLIPKKSGISLDRRLEQEPGQGALVTVARIIIARGTSYISATEPTTASQLT